MSPSYLLIVNGKQYVREALPVAVVTTEAGTKALVVSPALKVADPPVDPAREAAEASLRAALEALFARMAPDVAARIAKGEMPSDEEIAQAFARVIEPELVETASEEFAKLGIEVGVQWDPALVNLEMTAWAREYSYGLVRGLTETTLKTLQSAMAEFARTPGMTRGQLEGLISAAFSSQRAEAIAVTEVTRAATAAMDGYLADLGAAGVKMERVFHTSHDERVCPICMPSNGKAETAWEGKGPPPRHSRCRCFLTLRLKDEP